jgi:hypothetical protein
MEDRDSPGEEVDTGDNPGEDRGTEGDQVGRGGRAFVVVTTVYFDRLPIKADRLLLKAI